MWRNAPPYTKVLILPEPQIDIAREKAAMMAIQVKAHHVFFLDTDVYVPEDALQRLLRHKLPIVSGLYARRHHPPWNQMLKTVEGGYKPVGQGEYEKGSLQECDALGMGCCLIETKVFKEMEKPWFRWTESMAIVGS